MPPRRRFWDVTAVFPDRQERAYFTFPTIFASASTSALDQKQTYSEAAFMSAKDDEATFLLNA
jgi:hypothetical protein